MAKKIQFGGEMLEAMETGDGGLALVTGSDFIVKSVSFGTADSESGELDCGEGMRLVGYTLDAAFVATTMTYKVGHTAGTRQALYNADAAVSDTVAASKNVSVDVVPFYPWRYVSFVAGTVQNGTVSSISAVLATI
jgi:hypothetical protein